ncbi:hypothetical protein BJ741DRAFT_562615 [Chytriomyces cf. hyalinus JEL632]|nr:hypothetical protein BJ741DRAFT_562615 [Chytriomyces cf. hyalinus JEL632]
MSSQDNTAASEQNADEKSHAGETEGIRSAHANKAEGSSGKSPSTPTTQPSIEWMHVVYSEIGSVTGAMRKNARWALSDSYSAYSYRESYRERYRDVARESDSDTNTVDQTGGSSGGAAESRQSRDNKRDSSRDSPSQRDPTRLLLLMDDYDFALDSVAAMRANAAANPNNLNNVIAFTRAQAARAGRRSLFASPVLTDGPLMAGFSRLRARMSLVEDLALLEPVHLLAPFLDVIKSGDTTGPITGAALSAVEKFITYKVIDPNHPSLPHAMSLLTHTVSNCKFEATDAVSDEVVLSKILRLIRVTVESEAGQKTLDDKAICEMVETAFGMCFQGRVSELLKRSAEQTLVVLVQVLFERLDRIMNEEERPDRLETLFPGGLSTAGSSSVTSNIIKSLQSRQNKDAETVFASMKGQQEGDSSDSLNINNQLNNDGPFLNGTNLSQSGGGPLISIADPSGSVASNEPEMVTVGSQDSDSELKNDDYSVGKSANTADMKSSRSDDLASSDEKNDPKSTSNTESAGDAKSKQPLAGNTSKKEQKQHQQQRILSPFGLPAILELIRVLVTLMDPRNRNHTDTAHRLIALTLLNVGIEVGGQSLGKWIGWGYQVEASRAKIGEDALHSDDERMALAAKELVVNELIKYLFQLLQNTNMTFNSPPSSNAMTLLSSTLRVLTSLFQTSRIYLKFQFEFFLDWIMTKVNTGVLSWDVGDANDASSTSSPSDKAASSSDVTASRGSVVVSPSVSSAAAAAGRNVLVAEARELLLETMVQCARIPGFFTELWVNFDGEVGCRGNLYEEIVRFLSKHTFPDATPGGPVTTIHHQVLCVDGLLLLLRRIAEGKSNESRLSDNSSVDELSPQELMAVKLRKRLLAEGAERFNSSPKEGIKFLQEQELLPTPADPHSIAVFLKTTPGVNKKLIGEYIAKRGNEDILKTFIKLYNFKGKRLDEGLRLLLESFRLPGEAQLIERVVENFADGYFHAMEDTHDTHIADQSSGFVLAFSIILLNTDQHNPQVRRRMTREDFQKNNRGCNNGKDFDPEYLGQIYEAIKGNEIVMPEEHEGDLGFNYAWRELMKRAEGGTMSPMMRVPKGVFSRDMFAVIVDPTVAAISYAFDSSEDSLTLQKAVVGFHQCAAIANTYQMTEVLDNIVIRLSKTTGLLKDGGKLPAERASEDNHLANGDKPSPHRVDPWAVEFGRNYKSQVAAVLMFNLVAEYGNTLKDGWKNVIDVLGNLFLHALLPSNLLTTDNFIRKNVPIPRLEPPEKPAAAPKRETGGSSLFFSLTQLLSLSSQDDSYEQPPSPEELEAEQKALACIASCRAEELFVDTRFLEEAALNHILSLLAQACYQPTKPVSGSSQASLFPNGNAEKESDAGTTDQDPLLPKTGAEANGTVEKGRWSRYSISVAFFLELTVSITFHNRDRLRVVWPAAFALISKILGNGCPEYPPLMERAVVGLLRLLTRMVHKDDMLPQVFQSIDLLTALPQETLTIVSEQLTAGLLQLIKTDPTLIPRYPKCEQVLHLLAATSMHPESARYSLDAVCILVGDSLVPGCLLTADSFGDCVDLLLSFATSAGGILLGAQGEPSVKTAASPRPTVKSVNAQAASDRAVRALDRVFALHSKIPAMVATAGVGREKAWFVFWLPVLSGLAQQCYNPGREIRQHSLTLLQRALLSSELESTVMTPKPSATGEIEPITTSTLETGVDVFESVLFPLLFELLKPEVSQLDAGGMDETRMRVAALLCKIFLQYLNRLLRFRELPILWVKVLDFMNKYVNAGGSEFVSEGVLESLKNMLLVMSTQKVFEPMDQAPETPPTDPNSHNLWILTWQHIDRIYPGLKEELFPDPVKAQTK